MGHQRRRRHLALVAFLFTSAVSTAQGENDTTVNTTTPTVYAVTPPSFIAWQQTVPLWLLISSTAGGGSLLLMIVLLVACLLYRKRSREKRYRVKSRPGDDSVAVSIAVSSDEDDEADYVNVDPNVTKQGLQGGEGRMEDQDSNDYENLDSKDDHNCKVPESDDDHDYEDAESRDGRGREVPESDDDHDYKDAESRVEPKYRIRESRDDQDCEEPESGDDDDYENVAPEANCTSYGDQVVEIYGEQEDVYQNL